ncbi:hypothetical protein C2E23DRAFT_890883 [Lenzites betulinus]|nr:hypothetical protein C2E23DRAFT_890883 [Lenzites betulinus]
MPPITQHFSVLPKTSAALEKKVNMAEETDKPLQPVLVACQHLQGLQYEEYILRIQTQSLGGILPTFRALIARQVFPYTPFPFIQDHEVRKEKECTEGMPIKPNLFASSPEPPTTGNSKLEESLWTREEQHYFDNTLKGFAHWEVDYPHHFVKAKGCTSTTMNTSGVCNQCEDFIQESSILEEEENFWNPPEDRIPSGLLADDEQSPSPPDSNEIVPDPPSPADNSWEAFYQAVINGHNAARELHEVNQANPRINPLAIQHVRDAAWHLLQAIRILRHDIPYPIPGQAVAFPEWLEIHAHNLQQLVGVTHPYDPAFATTVTLLQNIAAARFLVNQWATSQPSQYHGPDH